jgi:hypothetical protein
VFAIVAFVVASGRTGVHGRPPLPALVIVFCMTGRDACGNNPGGLLEGSSIISSSSLSPNAVLLEEDGVEAEANGVDGHP